MNRADRFKARYTEQQRRAAKAALAIPTMTPAKVVRAAAAGQLEGCEPFDLAPATAQKWRTDAAKKARRARALEAEYLTPEEGARVVYGMGAELVREEMQRLTDAAASAPADLAAVERAAKAMAALQRVLQAPRAPHTPDLDEPSDPNKQARIRLEKRAAELDAQLTSEGPPHDEGEPAPNGVHPKDDRGEATTPDQATATNEATTPSDRDRDETNEAADRPEAERRADERSTPSFLPAARPAIPPAMGDLPGLTRRRTPQGTF